MPHALRFPYELPNKIGIGLPLPCCLAALLLENIELNDAYSVADHVALLEQQYDMPSPDSLFADAVNLVERMRIKGLVLCRAKAG